MCYTKQHSLWNSPLSYTNIPSSTCKVSPRGQETFCVICILMFTSNFTLQHALFFLRQSLNRCCCGCCHVWRKPWHETTSGSSCRSNLPILISTFRFPFLAMSCICLTNWKTISFLLLPNHLTPCAKPLNSGKLSCPKRKRLHTLIRPFVHT